LLNSYIYILLNNDFSKHVLWSPVSKPLDVLAAYISATLHVTSPCYALDGIPLVKHNAVPFPQMQHGLPIFQNAIPSGFNHQMTPIYHDITKAFSYAMPCAQ
jgi:hypothetical protein